jgi:hypothetical protein
MGTGGQQFFLTFHFYYANPAVSSYFQIGMIAEGRDGEVDFTGGIQYGRVFVHTDGDMIDGKIYLIFFHGLF